MTPLVTVLVSKVKLYAFGSQRAYSVAFPVGVYDPAEAGVVGDVYPLIP